MVLGNLRGQQRNCHMISLLLKREIERWLEQSQGQPPIQERIHLLECYLQVSMPLGLVSLLCVDACHTKNRRKDCVSVVCRHYLGWIHAWCSLLCHCPGWKWGIVMFAEDEGIHSCYWWPEVFPSSWTGKRDWLPLPKKFFLKASTSTVYHLLGNLKTNHRKAKEKLFLGRWLAIQWSTPIT